MTLQYSEELIIRITTYIKKRCSLDITRETATEYLDSLADLHSSFIESFDPKNLK